VGTAGAQGKLWGASAEDWSEFQEPAWVPVFERVLDLAGVGEGTRYLDIGCGAGGALLRAAERNAEIAGIDAAEALVEIARRRLPGRPIELGEMEELPFPDRGFDVVTGINAFQFAGDPVVALREAGRVCRHGGTVLALAWGEREKCELMKATFGALSPLLPPSNDGPSPFARPGGIEDAMRSAGLGRRDSGAFEASLAYADHASAVRAFGSSGIANRARQLAGDRAVRDALGPALQPYVQPDGRVVLSNHFRWAVATPV
jgi:SAM-dependent methyltransferase